MFVHDITGSTSLAGLVIPGNERGGTPSAMGNHFIHSAMVAGVIIVHLKDLAVFILSLAVSSG